MPRRALGKENAMHYVFKGALLLLVWASGCSSTNSPGREASSTQITEASCDGPDAELACHFLGMPATPGSEVVLAGEDEPGERMVIEAQLLDAEGNPLPGWDLYHYHTNAEGLYAKRGDETGVQRWHGALHGWCRTDAEGRFVIRSIRPAPYPSLTMPAHIHTVVRDPEGYAFFINDFVFADDALVNQAYLERLSQPGGNGVVDLRKDSSGTWRGSRAIVLTD